MLKAAANKQDTGKSQYFVWPKFVELLLSLSGIWWWDCFLLQLIMFGYCTGPIALQGAVMKEINWK